MIPSRTLGPWAIAAAALLFALASPVRAETAAPQTPPAGPEAKKPESNQPDAKKPDAKKPDAKTAEEQEPEATQPEATQPEATQPEATKPEEAPAPVRKVDQTLDEYRTPFETLAETTIGKAARPVRYDWRKSKVGFGLIGSELYELNNFWSAAYGLFVRSPMSGIMLELAVTRVQTWSTESSDMLSKTPYRQWGRPDRFEVDVNIGLPIAEGIVTVWPRFFPAAELVLSLVGGFRYAIYPQAFAGLGFWEVTGAIFSPFLSDKELANMMDHRPPGMQVDAGRYSLLVGLANDIYFQNGFVISPRAMAAVPVLAGASRTHLLFWWELSMAVGVTF